MLKNPPSPGYFMICALFLSAFLSADDPSEKIIGALKKYTEEYPQEKIYLHLDRPYYTIGDTIWMKSYLVAGSFHQPSPLSLTVQVELLNAKKEVVRAVKLKSEKGFGSGFVSLPDSLAAGNYLIRAYTPWMKNFNEELFSHREVKIFELNATAPQSASSQQIDVQFFPEGGALVSGLRSKVGYKAVRSDGLGEEIQIKVVDQNNTEITKSASNKMGMGFFNFVPKTGDQYFAVVASSGEKFKLPEPRASGFVMSVTNKEEQPDLVLRLQTNEMTPDKDQVYVLAQCRGVVSLMLKSDLSKNLTFVKIPKANLMSGITHLTLFNSRGVPVAERLIFYDQRDELTVTLIPDKKVYQPREKVVLAVRATDRDKNPVAANFSLSVTDDTQVALGADRESIISQLWLSSDLTGNIENAGYYFNTSNPDRQEALDVLLLTQGWRRFVWRDILSDRWPEMRFPIDQGLTVSGKLVDKFSKKPVAGGKVSLLNSKSGDLQVGKTLDDGAFRFDQLIWFDTADVVLQGENKRGNKFVEFEISKVTDVPCVYPVSGSIRSLSEFEKSYIQKSIDRKHTDLEFEEKSITLQGVEISGNRIERPQENNNKIYGQGATSLKMSDIPNVQSYQHPLQALQGRVAGLLITGSGTSFNAQIRGVGSISGATTPIFMIDNVQVDINTLGMLRPGDIESVEVFKGAEAAVFGAEGANGAILFYTKPGGAVKSPKEGIFNLLLAGYISPREFYAPRYDRALPAHKKPDTRPTLFWQPFVQTDSTGNATVTFYNHDNETTVTGVLEGISGFGKPGTAVLHYEINKK
jgi:TonB-dependent SusC/RagA subfamily outer membrane receptor